MLIKRLYVFLNHKFIYNYDRKYPSVEEQKRFMKKLAKPKDDIEASYNKYLAQLFYYYSIPIRILFNLGGLFLWPILYCKYRRNFKLIRKISSIDEEQDYCGVVVIKGSKINPNDIIPSDFEEQYGKVDFIDLDENYIIDDESMQLFNLCLKKYFWHPYYLVIILRRLGETATLIKKYKLKAIAVYAKERDFTISVVTKYCEIMGIDYVGFMHGDDYFTVDKIDTRYTKYYVWDQHYVDMYCDLRCPKNQFIIYTPDKLKGITKPRDDDNYDFFMTYYFSAESKQIIQGVLKAFEIFKNDGLKCKIRPHPRFSNISYIEEVFKEYIIEDPKKVPLSVSIENTEYIASLNSTVLSQAYYSGKKIAIDDFSDPERYKAMIDRKYIMMQKEHVLIGELINKQR